MLSLCLLCIVISMSSEDVCVVSMLLFCFIMYGVCMDKRLDVLSMLLCLCFSLSLSMSMSMSLYRLTRGIRMGRDWDAGGGSRKSLL